MDDHRFVSSRCHLCNSTQLQVMLISNAPRLCGHRESRLTMTSTYSPTEQRSTHLQDTRSAVRLAMGLRDDLASQTTRRQMEESLSGEGWASEIAKVRCRVHRSAWICRNPRGRDGGVRQELAAGSSYGKDDDEAQRTRPSDPILRRHR